MANIEPAQDSPLPSTLQEFHLFPLLPSELRLKIWHISLSEPRVIEMSCKKAMLDRERRFAESFTSLTPPPSLLHINRESRFEALSIYTPYFQTPTSSNLTYANFALDTVSISDNTLAHLSPAEIDGIQLLKLEVHDAEYFGHYHIDTLKTMGKLRILDLFAKEGIVYAWHRPGRYIQALKNDFQGAKMNDPGWECPYVRIWNKDSKEMVGEIQEGALIPGWREGDEFPDDVIV